ncbi:hypothetical protein E4U46_000332 [Claviceps purpurea]|nr:hypothetical protein E4U37_003380 [Claviceps purpurea]KAG6281368.1 hypothetical protein E4U46_000332 [Claviceps purpurea]
MLLLLVAVTSIATAPPIASSVLQADQPYEPPYFLSAYLWAYHGHEAYRFHHGEGFENWHGMVDDEVFGVDLAVEIPMRIDISKLQDEIVCKSL